jgi:hypothetical protein
MSHYVDTSMMSHIYTQKLDVESHAIRTVTLLPGPWTSPIRCLLNNVTLDHASYNAVSYAWGDPDDKTYILVGDTQLAIPSNLEVALRYLRKPQALELWIDAICINQQDAVEKAHQVAMMGEIFRRSTYTYIWLGVPEAINAGGAREEQVDPFAVIHHFAGDRHLYELPFFSTATSYNELSPSPSLADVSNSEIIWEAFQDAVHKPWWSRFWCVQECLLSPAAIIVLGHWTVPWSMVKLCEVNYKQHVSGCCSSSSGRLPEKYTFYADRTVTNTFLDSSRVVHVRAELSSSLDLLVRSFRNKICQDPRDKVYGILGLADESTKPELRVDYSLCTNSVYLDLMKSILSSDPGNLHCLTGLGFNSPEHSLPSWVRNLDAGLETAVLNFELTRFDQYNLYDAANSTKATTSIQSPNLSVDGIFVDKIQRVGKAIQCRGWQHILEVFQNWLDMAEVDISSTTSQAHFSQPRARSFWRTIVGDLRMESEQSSRRLTQDDMEALRYWLGSLLDAMSTGADPPMGPWLRSMLTAIYGRAMFFTQRGHIGMCYPDCRVGDEVWVLYGGRVPFVLRQIQEYDPRIAVGMPSHVFVGDCHLDEFMDGEAIRHGCSTSQSLLIQ